MMLNPKMTTNDFFEYARILPPEAPSYVARPEDDAVLTALQSGQLCWVSAPHHFGASSLLVRAAHQLQSKGMHTVIVSFAGSGGDNTNPEQLYLLVLRRLKKELSLEKDVQRWWLSHGDAPPPERLTRFLRDVVLRATEKPVAILVDGIGEDTRRDFVSEFFAVFAAAYSERKRDPQWERLNVVFAGRAIPADFGFSDTTPPFAGTHRLTLSEFQAEAMSHFRAAFPAATDEEWEVVWRHVFSWTQGHPYLTQKVLAEISRSWDNRWTIERIDDLVDTLFFTTEISIDPNLHFILNQIENAPNRKSLLKFYNRILAEKSTVNEDDTDPRQRTLVACGLVAARAGVLKVRNPIYRRVFNVAWIKSFAPTNWRFVIVVSLIFACLLAGLLFSVDFRRQEKTATQARTYIEQVEQAPGATEKLVSLAALFSLGQYKDEARELALNDLPREDLLAILSPMNPASVEKEIIIVVKGLYSAPQLRNAVDADALLEAMRQPLYQLEKQNSTRAVELNLEIGQWLRGREFYSKDGLYQRAVDSYNIALTVNSQNPGVYFDRALAYVALGQVDDALKDLKHVQSIDSSWRAVIQQTLTDDPILYATLWNNRQKYPDLVALAPSPTPTQLPTATPAMTNTPASPPTDEPPIPTVTPTSTPSPVPTATATAIPTATHLPPTATPRRIVVPTATRSAVENGTFQLLLPITTDPPTYGETEFRWRWTGDLPPGYGFEIRVWADGEAPLGAHDAVQDNQSGNVKFIGANEYRLTINIKDAAGVRQRSGEYNWAVVLIQYQPTYKDLGIVSAPARLRFDVPSSGGGNGGGSGGNNGSGGGVGIE